MSRHPDPCYCLQAIDYEELLVRAVRRLTKIRDADLVAAIERVLAKYQDARKAYAMEDVHEPHTGTLLASSGGRRY